MRNKSIDVSNARICAGGKLAGYKGKMPGVLEEILTTVAKGVPVYLLGAFGGVVGDVCEAILEEHIPVTLTEDWQLTNNAGYADLQLIAKNDGHYSDYTEIGRLIQKIKVSELADRCGLCEAEYKRLMVSPFIDECVYMILKGLKSI